MKYRAKAKTWLSHECRMVNEGDVFETTFPKVKTKDGEVDMKLGENLELVEDKPEVKAKGKGKDDGANGLV